MKKVEKVEKSAKDPKPPLEELTSIFANVSKLESRVQLALGETRLTDWALLKLAAGDEPISMSELSRKLGVTRQRVSQMVMTLDQEGLVTSKQVDEKSRSISSTAEGKARIAECDRAVAAVFENISTAAKPLHASRMSSGRVLKALTKPEKGGKSE